MLAGRSSARRLAREAFEGAAGQLAQSLLAYAVGGRIHRGERCFERRLGAVGQQPVFGMDHLEAGRSRAHVAIQGKAGAADETAGLGIAEVEQAHRDVTGAVTDPCEKTPPGAVHRFGEFNLADDQRRPARPQRANRRDGGAILEPQRQVEQQVLDRLEPGLAEFACQRRANAR